MPPRKKRRRSAQKAQLLFHQPPLEGPKHHSRAPLRPITHTRRVPSKPIDHSTITSWVSPQFDTTESWFPTYRKPLRRDQARHSSRKSTTSKFPHLTFETPQSSSSASIEIPSIRECPAQPEQDVSGGPLVPMLSPQSCGELSAHALQSLPYVFIPPDIQTPESSVKEGPTPSDLRGKSLPRGSLYTSTPKTPQPVPVLAEDTPEDKYGIKVTWRRRQHLLTYLQETGKLSKSQFLVKS
ncbi:RAD9, HUS1, RAD1-interacting nuclear orphan protein 1 [Talpa occidentalis]|uniref:RAD9, HUS1, RAD1-interacting nuclear orphan protein 1 n=1 Tax=Talpa occidentalis TaxID=50954 RepID=UPI00188E9D01|nr:RAD9, HUS1, RAD1-interacting nuclear orphan protein 1 [Talpa occidentalis]XP_037370443.1 RAD9, HUS1, RAD1-interacting nuclear orphan protein 1 [Talpa occidentalis]XP_037370444.1 RAD9, HUS1, RAD1-interacting nuclear orphan protein 1 [Talpa occidentalis]XP_037370447.1 RAD9, HUS1, RAD1-interacting nuclear orphan protein 1 [Talpa occidentalis]XP_037370449.1 RAD9, HUS1, RAD1-interacting nuclear orphan protein 1 [Talpa occidentalis]XP_054552495.1 RAD9, HUS1, RAD1-interacting nuclear orphan protei